MSITVEELEIRIEVQKKQAIADLEEVRKKLEAMFAQAMPGMIKAMNQVQQAVQQSAAAVAPVVQAAAENAKKSVAAVAPTVQAAAGQVKAATDSMAAQYGILGRQIELQKEKIDRLKASLEAGVGGEAFLSKTYAQLQQAQIQLDKMGLNADKLKEKMENPTKETKKLGNELQDTAQRGKTALDQLGAAITRALKFAVAYKGLRAMFNFIKEGLQNAINAPEIENMFRVAFGAGAEEAAKFAEAMKKAYGIDPYVSKEMLGTVQNMSTAMGIGTQNASEMSKGLTLLANDMASLYNVDPKQAAENLQSALSGQGRAVRKYGYIILDSTIKETAYRLGIAETGAELTEQQKVLARYMTLQEQSKNAQGDLARTIGNVANQLRILAQNIIAAGRSIGTALIPFIQAATPALNAFFIVLQRTGDALAKFTFGLFGIDFSEWKKQQEAIIGGTGDMSQSSDEYADSAEKAAKAQNKLLSGFDKLNISKSKESAATGVPGDGGFIIPDVEAPTGQSPFEKMADALQASLEKIKEMFQPFITNVGDSFKWLFDKVLRPWADYEVNERLPAFFEALAAVLNSPVWATVGEQIAKIYDEFLQPVASWAGEKVVELFKWIKDNGDLVAKAVIAIGVAFLTWKVILTLDKVSKIILAISGALKGLSFAKVGTALSGALSKTLPSLSKVFPVLSKAISGAATALVGFLATPAGLVTAAIVAAVIAAVVAIVLNWDTIVEFFTVTIPNWWKNTVEPFFLNMWQGLLDGVDIAIQWVTGAWNKFIAFLKENLDKAIVAIKQWGTDVWNFISVEVPNWVSSVVQWFSELPSKIWTWLVSAYEKVKQWGTDLINWAKLEIPKFITSVVEFFKELPGKVWDVGVDIVTSLWDGIQSKVSWLWDMLKDFVDGFKEGFNGGSVEVDVNRNGGNAKPLNTNSRMSLPHLARGGVLTSPRLVMGGEYPGASTNPEIVTPQSLMYETSLKAQQAANQPLLAVMTQVLQAIKDGKVIELDGYQLGRQLDRISSNNNLLLGI